MKIQYIYHIQLNFTDTASARFEIIAASEAHAITIASRRKITSWRNDYGATLKSIEILEKRNIPEVAMYQYMHSLPESEGNK